MHNDAVIPAGAELIAFVRDYRFALENAVDEPRIPNHNRHSDQRNDQHCGQRPWRRRCVIDSQAVAQVRDRWNQSGEYADGSNADDGDDCQRR